ncbi:MAG: UDP-N-acetylmuramoyl-tripeptide--D-alanyl-D-alanine ligase [Solirubrobacterales bacterium]|nr:UDP-N-acetylmuramoyl-tripeptide--D-alanyl-D-alanine ligase [Solirubrobacterales bacterium]
MRSWSAEDVATKAGARLIAPPPNDQRPRRAIIDSRQVDSGDLFVGLPGLNVDGGSFAPQALAAGAWGTLTTPANAEAARCAAPGVLLAAEDPLRALQSLANAWRRELGAKVIGVTGSTGKTSTKDLLAALVGPQRKTVASRQNFNTEIGLPLEILEAPSGTEVLVLEMAMRGAGQIAELASIAEPDVAVIVNVGPVHLELLGTLEAIAAAKAELIAALRPGGTAVVPAAEPLLEPHLRDDINVITFGPGGQVSMKEEADDRVVIALEHDGQLELELDFAERHLRSNLLAAVAAARAIGVRPEGLIRLERSPGRGRRVKLANDVTLIDDCYNANPMSMSAALHELAAVGERQAAPRRLAVLGDMLELGPREREYHLELGAHSAAAEVDVLITVGPLAAAAAEQFPGESYSVADAGEAAALLPELLAPGDVVLVKGSRAVGLDLVCGAMQELR